MPYAIHNGVRLYWEERGSGPPLLLIMGLSFTLEMWHRVTPEFAKDYRVILLDNRGVGRSDIPPGGRYTIGAMAEDALAVLDAAGVNEPALVLGASMGGMIAQELTLRHPERVQALVLGCTACGPLFRAAWPKLEWSPGLWQWITSRGELRERALVRLLYANTTPLDRIEEDIAIRAACQPPVHAVLRQLAGILSWSSYSRLPQIKAPTLVVHGEQDHVLPPANGRMVASRISNSEFILLPNAGHILTTDQPELSLQIVGRFLETVRAGEYAPDAGLRDVAVTTAPDLVARRSQFPQQSPRLHVS
ncbi:MAG: alpha/beta fold hydrolase, partial [Bryobacteraceae bacterium]